MVTIIEQWWRHSARKSREVGHHRVKKEGHDLIKTSADLTFNIEMLNMTISLFDFDLDKWPHIFQLFPIQESPNLPKVQLFDKQTYWTIFNLINKILSLNNNANTWITWHLLWHQLVIVSNFQTFSLKKQNQKFVSMWPCNGYSSTVTGHTYSSTVFYFLSCFLL